MTKSLFQELSKKEKKCFEVQSLKPKTENCVNNGTALLLLLKYSQTIQH
jgi:hypothetical protein